MADIDFAVCAPKVVRHAKNEGLCDFLRDFVTDWNTERVQTSGMIFGAGDVILQYYAGMMLCRNLKARGAFPPLGQATEQALREQANLWKTNHALVAQRSNTYVAFTDNLKVKVDRHRDNPFYLAFQDRRASREQAEFFEKFSHSRYPVSVTPPRSLARGLIKDNDNWAFDGVNITGGDLISIRQFMTRRACKFLMYDVALDQHAPIRYALDGLERGEILDKTARDLGREEGLGGKVPVCTSELRELFRMWNFFQPHVSFYRHFDLAQPLWADGNAAEIQAWSDYAYRRMMKELETALQRDYAVQHKALGETFADMTIAKLAGNHATVIALYHATDYRHFPSAINKHGSLPTDDFDAHL